MAVLTQRSGYAISEQFRVQSNGTTPVAFMTVFAGTVIEKIIVRVETPGTGAANLTVGDLGDADGYITASDHTSSAGSIFGDTPSERGAYMYDSTIKGSFSKLYNAGDTLSLVLSAAGTIQGVFQIHVTGHKYDIG